MNSFHIEIHTPLLLHESELLSAIEKVTGPLYKSSDLFPTLHIGFEEESLSGVSIHHDEESYIVEITHFSTMVDYLLAADIVRCILDLTKGKVTDENGIVISSLSDALSSDYLCQLMIEGLCEAISYVDTYDRPLTFQGLLRPYGLGHFVMHMFDVSPYQSTFKERALQVLNYLKETQWKYKDIPTTAAPSLTQEVDEYILTFSLLEKSEEPCLIVAADNIIVADQEVGMWSHLPYEETYKLLPDDYYTRIDDATYLLQRPLTQEDINRIFGMTMALRNVRPYYLKHFAKQEEYDVRELRELRKKALRNDDAAIVAYGAYKAAFCVGTSEEEGFDLVDRIAAKNNPEAIAQLGILYFGGLGVMPNIERAKNCFRIAYNQGYEKALKYMQLLLAYEQEESLSSHQMEYMTIAEMADA